MIAIASEMNQNVPETCIQPDARADSGRMAAAERIVASQNFSKSGRLTAFLLHIVRCTVEGRTDEQQNSRSAYRSLAVCPATIPAKTIS